MIFFRRIHLVLLLLILAGCMTFAPPPPPGIGQPLDWSHLPGWQADAHGEAWPALLQSCVRLERNTDIWRDLCRAARRLGTAHRVPDHATARRFFQTWFVPHQLWDGDGDRDGLLTGYYEPHLRGSLTPTDTFRYPLYGKPKDLLTIDLGRLYPALAGRPARGRLLEDGRVVPYFTRKQIEAPGRPLQGNEIAWVDDPVALFFLHIQGSGRLHLPDDQVLAVGYADRNGHPYVAIGRYLIRKGEMQREEVSLQSIRAWLQRNPHRADEVLNANPNYIFFTSRKAQDDRGPMGALGVPLSAERSIAVDPRFVSLGLPVWVDSSLPNLGSGELPFRKLVFAQDTGSAIRGPVRADLFLGSGLPAEEQAGRMRQSVRLYVLLPKAMVR